jgi:transcriptional regulator with XRE-family HTH domain
MSRGSELITQARRRSGLSQAELARRAEMARPIVNAYERGRREPSVAAAERLLAAAGWRLVIAPALRFPDPQRAARDLEAVLGLADAIPVRSRRGLEFPPFPRR